MAYTEEHTKEKLSVAYVSAVAGMAGTLISQPDFDYGIDGTLISVDRDGSRIRQSPYHLDYQLKTTINWEKDSLNKNIIYDLEVKTYNDMVSRAQDDASLILILLCLPKDRNSWLKISSEELILKHCCYWYKATGEKSTNKKSVRIQIPVDNLLTVDALKNLLSDESSRRKAQFR